MVQRQPAKQVKDLYSKAKSYVVDEWIGSWTPESIGDQTGKTALITGGNSGIGFETALKLAENGAQVFIVSRDLKRGQEAASKIREQIGKPVKVWVLECDMSRLDNVLSLVREFKRHSQTLDILINNAGVFHPGAYAQTVDGIEQTLAINYYSHALLTLLLLDTLRSTPQSRVLFQSSIAEAAGKLDFNNLKGDKFKDSGMTPYGTSKVFMLMFARELGVRVPEVDFFCVQPGIVLTPLQHKISWRYWTAVAIYGAAHIYGLSPYQGAFSTMYAATEPSLTGTHRGFYGPNHLNLCPTVNREPMQGVARNPVACWRLLEATVRILNDLVGQKQSVSVPRHPDAREGAPAQGNGRARQDLSPMPMPA